MTDEEIEQGFQDQPMSPQALGAYEIWVTAVRWAEGLANKEGYEHGHAEATRQAIEGEARETASAYAAVKAWAGTADLVGDGPGLDGYNQARLHVREMLRSMQDYEKVACHLCGGTGLAAYELSNIAPKSALRAWIEGVRDEVLMPLAERSRSDLGATAEGFGQESVALLAALEVPYANHPQWVLGFEAGRKAERK